MNHPTSFIKSLLSILVFSLFAAVSFGQANDQKITLSGTVVDSLGNGVEYATVSIVDTAGRAVTSAAADGNGKFSIELKQKGDFSLSAGSLGYSEASKKIDIDWSKPKVDLGNIVLVQGIEVKEVRVEAFKPLIKVDADKLTYSVEADPESETSTLAEMLRKVPQLSVDGEDNVLLNGQSSYKVLVNGKNSAMYSRNFKEVIRSMPANSIKDIEVITNPSSKYEAEGVGGIINIITHKKSNVSGYNGRINAGAGSFGTYNGGVYLAMQQNKLNLTLNYNGGNYGMPPQYSNSEGINRLSDELMYNNSQSVNDDGRQQFHNYSLSGSYDIDSLNLITIELWGYHGSYKINSLTDYEYFDKDRILTGQYTRNSRNGQKFAAMSGSLDYQKLFKKPEQSLTFSYKLDNNPGASNYNMGIEVFQNVNNVLQFDNGTGYGERSDNKSYGTEHTFQADFYNPLKNNKHVIEMGVKHIIRLNDSDTEVERQSASGEWLPYHDNMNDMDYTQNIFGAYGGYSYKLQKFSARAGVRMEGTWNDGVAKTKDGNIDIKNDMFNVVPYASFSYQLKPAKTLRASYTQRLQRPGIWYLNPYVDRSNPLSIRYGNPGLKSTVNHSFSVGYSQFSQKFNLTLNATADISNNSITNITIAKDDGVMENTFDNIGLNRSLGMNAYISYSPISKLRLTVNGNVRYIKLANSYNNIENDGASAFVNANGQWTAWKNGSVNAGLYYGSGSVSLYGSYPGYTGFNFGVSHEFFKKLRLSVNINNPFKFYKTQSYNMESPDFYEYVMYKYVQRRLSFNVGYRFGKMANIQTKKARRGIVNDDKMSGGESGGAAVGAGGGQ